MAAVIAFIEANPQLIQQLLAIIGQVLNLIETGKIPPTVAANLLSHIPPAAGTTTTS